MKISGGVRLALITACLYGAMAGCGYHFAGSGGLTGGINKISISVFQNRSSLLGIENDFNDSLTREFTRRHAAALVEADKADAILSGVIQSISTDTVTYRDQYASAERRVRVTLNVRLVSRDGRTVWADDHISGSEAYLVAAQKPATDQNLRQAVRKLADDLAQRMYNQMTANF